MLTEIVEFEGRMYRVEWFSGVPVPPSARVTQVSGVCFTDSGEIVLVSGDGITWGLPGGHPKAGESPEDALRREVAEEACAKVLKSEYLGYQTCAPEEGGESDIQLRYAASVRLAPFDQRHETTERKLVAPEDFLKTLAWGDTPIAAELAHLAGESRKRLCVSASSYRIDPYDPVWPKMANEEMANIAAALKVEPWRLEHVGSTAVPGLGAKPIIDLMLGVAGSPKSASNLKFLEPLRRIGYEHEGTETVPGTLYIRKADPRRFNLHMTEYGTGFWVDHLLFRDYLRMHGEATRDYEELKHKLMAKFAVDQDRTAYSDGKDAFIAAVLKKARND